MIIIQHLIIILHILFCEIIILGTSVDGLIDRNTGILPTSIRRCQAV
ncbi:hypothetical protein [Methanobacterium sp. BAmetb5]|nr:hypothetical protein [Methanobacterium sp. BAmetb5]